MEAENSQRLTSSLCKHAREEADHGIGAGTDNQAQVKRPRKSLKAQERLEVIHYYEQNKDKSMTEISRVLKIPRTTLYGILKDREPAWLKD